MTGYFAGEIGEKLCDAYMGGIVWTRMKIKNGDDLGITPLRKDALAIAEAGLQAIDTAEVIRKHVAYADGVLTVRGERVTLADGGRLIVAGIGKCAGRAAGELERILGDAITTGFIIAIGEALELKKITVRQGTHPLPSRENVDASKELVGMLSELHENDLVIFLVTGGGSTLLCLPDDGDYEREAKMFKAFMHSGAPIQDINTARKHMSRVRGGFLAKAMYPARVISLIFNDVPGSDDIGFIASGPTVKDTTTIGDAEAVLERYKILDACKLTGCGLMETPKDDKYFERVTNIVAVSNVTALRAMKEKAEELGYKAEIADTKIAGEARGVGRVIGERLAEVPAGTALLWGGETTVTVRNPEGKGGRNQELVLGALGAITPRTLVLSVASDGRDNTELGGALCDTMVKEKAEELRISFSDALQENQSYEFSKATGNYLDTGETGSNISDLILGITQQ
jgi:glycerate-2-kinase